MAGVSVRSVFTVSLMCMCVCFLNSVLLVFFKSWVLVRQVNMHICALCPPRSCPPLFTHTNKHTHTHAHTLDIALASHCVQSCSSGRVLLIPQPAMWLSARLPLCATGFDMEIQPEEPGKPLMRDRESAERIKEHKRREGEGKKKIPKFAHRYHLTERKRSAV